MIYIDSILEIDITHDFPETNINQVSNPLFLANIAKNLQLLLCTMIIDDVAQQIIDGDLDQFVLNLYNQRITEGYLP
jgi:hypothetical protein